jgi:hypothetical protein
MNNPLVNIHNVESGETIQREMTEDELVVWQLDQEKIASAVLLQEEKAKAKAAAEAKLAALGLDAEDLKALGL